MSTESTTEQIADLTDLIAEQRTIIEEQREIIDEQAVQLAQQHNEVTSRLDDLEAVITTTDIDERFERLERRVDIKHERHLSRVDTILVGDESGYLTDEQETFLADHDSVLDCLQTLTDELTQSTTTNTPAAATTRLRRILESVADSVGIDTDDALGGAGEDTLTRLLRYGPSDITDRVYAVHNRARDLLSHIGEWGHTVKDAYGRRVTITAAVVKEKLSLKRGEQLTSTEVRRIFEKLEALAADSPREVRADTGGRSPNRLLIRLPE
ncbi:hypothetical protein [Halobaculum limi]|uniref:hypothetical protein n=1 Tax=Halobaculum limi TaxID=3031916 RepID=UPI002406C771|nr:hypothetical protein [Halobaculum sp. YSMS11]